MSFKTSPKSFFKKSFSIAGAALLAAVAEPAVSVLAPVAEAAPQYEPFSQVGGASGGGSTPIGYSVQYGSMQDERAGLAFVTLGVSTITAGSEKKWTSDSDIYFGGSLAIGYYLYHGSEGLLGFDAKGKF
jgi:FAD/FMN-containing dehydrogenase